MSHLTCLTSPMITEVELDFIFWNPANAILGQIYIIKPDQSHGPSMVDNLFYCFYLYFVKTRLLTRLPICIILHY